MKHLYCSSLILILLVVLLAKTGAAQTDPQPVCGNGMIELSTAPVILTEECDGAALAEQTCSSLGFSGGPLSCTATCQFETRDCTDGPRVYVVSTRKNRVSAISTATNTVIATIRVGKRPRGIALSPNGALAYVTNFGGNTVSVINTATNTVLGRIRVGRGPQGVAFTPDGARAYVVNSRSNTVSVISGVFSSESAILVGADLLGFNGPGEIPVGQEPQAIAITPDGLRAYVTNFADDTVSILNLTTNTVEATITVGDGPNGVAVTPDGTRVIVANFNGGTISVIDTNTNTVTDTREVGLLPAKVTFSADGATTFVTNFQDETVEVIRTADLASLTFYNVGDSPDGIVVTTAGRRAYVALFDRAGRGRAVGVFNATTGADITFIRVPRGPFAIAVTPSSP
ncbi:MAG: beta-propeller fold lactonase family protein [Candidatus Binatia bacterium]